MQVVKKALHPGLGIKRFFQDKTAPTPQTALSTSIMVDEFASQNLFSTATDPKAGKGRAVSPHRIPIETPKETLMKSVFTFAAFAVFATVPFSAALAQEMSDADKRSLLENILLADTNNDGMLFLSEFEALIQLNAEDGLGKAATIERAGISEMLFKKLDSNGDGGLTKEEAQALAQERG